MAKELAQAKKKNQSLASQLGMYRIKHAHLKYFKKVVARHRTVLLEKDRKLKVMRQQYLGLKERLKHKSSLQKRKLSQVSYLEARNAKLKEKLVLHVQKDE